MNKKACTIILLAVLFMLFMTSCAGNDAKVAREIPSGFVQLPKDGGDWDNGLHYVSWESQISFLDANETCIYQTRFDNSDFIVQYENQYYVDKAKLQELIDQYKVDGSVAFESVTKKGDIV